MLRINECLKVDNLRVRATYLLFCTEQQRRGAVSTNRVANHCLDRVINVVASGTDLDGQDQCLTTRVRANEVGRALERGQRTCAPKAKHRSSLHILVESHVPDQTTSYI